MVRTCLMSLLLTLSLALPAGALPWLDDFAAAKKAAAASGKPIVVAVIGSDWSAPCQLMETEVFSRKEFATASSGWILVKLDHLRQSVQAERLRVQNKKFAELYPFDGFPTFFVLDAQGLAYGKQTGFVGGGVQAFAALVAGFEGHRAVLTGLADAVKKATAGTARAQAQDTLFRQAEAWNLAAQYADLPLKIVQEDKDGKAGLKARYQVYNAYQRLLNTWADRDDYRTVIADLDQLADKATAWPDLRQKVLFTKGMVLWNALDDEHAARDAFRQVRDLVPGTPTAERAAGFLDKLP